MRASIAYLVAFALCMSSAPALAADVESGPTVGEKVAELKILPLTGDLAGKELDIVAERKQKPTIYVFVQAEQFGRPTARYLKTLDEAVTKIGGDATVFAVWLTGDADKTKAYLPKVQMSIKLEATTLAMYPGDKAGPNGWGLNDRAFVTTVVANGQKTAAKFAYVSLNETDVRAVVAALKKSLDAKDKKTDK
jgi:hypothetical protein